jgi:SulP family sulfate permease
VSFNISGVLPRPKLLDCLSSYNRAQLVSDLVGGLTVGILALPLAMAFAIASGVKPEQGIYTAVVAGFLISALGGSRVQIGGPTGAFVVIVAGIVQKYGLQGLTICTLMAGVILVIIGMSGLGSVIRYIPRPVTIGFTNGIALLILSTQINDFLGLRLQHVPAEFVPKLQALGGHLHALDWTTVALSAGTLALIIVWPRLPFKRVPAPIVALAAATVATVALNLPVETIGSRFGGVPSGLPALHVPTIDFSSVPGLIGPATTIALLGAIESLLSAVVADEAIGDRHDPRSELVAQGIANIASPLFGGIPATGAIARTAANIRSGGVTPVAGIVHALTLLTVLLVAAPFARFIPIPALSAVLVMVAYSMGEWNELPKIVRLPKSDVTVWATTFGMTVLFDLTLAVEIGMILAALLFIKRVSETTTVEPVTDEEQDAGAEHVLFGREIPDGVEVIRIHGPFLFGASDKLEHALDALPQLPPVLVLRMRHVPATDATALHTLEKLLKRCRAAGTELILCGARPQPLQAMERAGFIEHLGPRNCCPHISAALDRSRELLAARPRAEPATPSPRARGATALATTK